VQIFTELHAGTSEEIFMALIFTPYHVETTPTSINYVYDITFSPDFAVLIFAATQPIREKRKNLHHAKISRYTVCVCIVTVVSRASTNSRVSIHV
jgi:hypothetical protein